MAENIWVQGQESYFNEDAKFFKDVYIYGKLYYDDLLGISGSIDAPNINVSGIATIKNLFVTGVSTFLGNVSIASTVSVAGTATFGGNVAISSALTAATLDVDSIDVGIATVRERFEITSDGGTRYVTAFGSGGRAGNVGIGSTLPDQKLDVAGSVRIDQNIFDSVNSSGANGYYLSRDAGGIRWVDAAPDAQVNGFFIQNEGTFVTGAGTSFTTINFIGTRSGGDLVNATDAGGGVIDVDIIDHWTKNGSGIHTTVNVGINVVSPQTTLDVGGVAWFRDELRVSGVATFTQEVRIDAPLRVHLNDIIGTATTAVYAHNAGVATVSYATSYAPLAGIATFARIAGVATYAKNAGIATFARIAGIATFARQAGFATVAGISTRSNVAFAATFAKQAGFATASGISTFSRISGISTFANQAGFATVSGISTFSRLAGIATFARQAGFATVSGISTFANQAGFSTVAGIATFANQSGFATVAGFATNAARAGIATFIETVQTLTNQDFFIPFVENSTSTGIETVRVDSGITYNPSTNALGIDGTLEVGAASTVIATNAVGNIGFNSTIPTRAVDFQKDVRFQQAIYDLNDNVGFRTEKYQVPRNVLTTVGVDTTGAIIGGRFYDAANLIRLNLDYIANESIGFLTSTDYKSPAFALSSADYTSCKDDIKDILKAITYDITRGGNSRCVGAGESYYNGGVLQHITGTDVNGYSIKEATIVAITTAAQVSRYVINNLPAPRSYQGVGNSVPLIRDLTLQDDPAVGFNTDPGGCANVVSAITVCAGIVTNIIELGAAAFTTIGFTTTSPNGKIIWAPPGADAKNIVYVSKYGNDDNDGRTEGSAKLTIGAAAAVAQPGDTIMVRSGVYAENNPIGLRTDVSVIGQDLRLVTIYPQNNDDVFYVRRGCLIDSLSFAYSKDPYDDAAPLFIKGAAVAFPPPAGIGSARSGFLGVGPANEGPSGRWRSPYVRNCTNFMTNSIGMKIDGNHVAAAFTGTNNLGQDLKCMVCDSFTQYNENGIGVSITNKAYAQLVSIFTINSKIGIFAASGGQCDLTNSNSSFGTFGLYADGTSGDEFTGITTGATVSAEEDTYNFFGIRDDIGNIRKPFDGQGAFFKINLDEYPDTGVKSGIVTEPLRTIRTIKITNGGSGYSAAAPPNITVSTPLGPEGILAELSANVSAAGTITSVDIISSGRNFLPPGSGSNQQDITVTISGSGGATAEAVTDPILYTVSTATEPTTVGVTTVTFNEFVPYSVGIGVSVSFRRLSRIITSSHSFEYIGAGTDINSANPFQGGVPNPDNEVVAINGGQIPFTSTDQKGNFRIGQGLTIDQTTSTISGRDFNRAIQANLTPLILALGG
jgi:hypothetical protein